MKRKRSVLLVWLLLAGLLIGGYGCFSMLKYRGAVTETKSLLQECIETAAFPDEARGMAGIMTDEEGLIRSCSFSHLEWDLGRETEAVKEIMKASSRDTGGDGIVHLQDGKYRYLSEPDPGGFRIAVAECKAEEDLIARLKRGGCCAAVLAVLLLPLLMLLFRRKPAEAVQDGDS